MQGRGVSANRAVSNVGVQSNGDEDGVVGRGSGKDYQWNPSWHPCLDGEGRGDPKS